MPKSPDEILGRELGRLGGLGARLASRFLGDNALVLEPTTRIPPSLAMEIAFGVLNSEGRLIEDGVHDSEQNTLSAVVGSGFCNLNPALVKVTVEQTPGGETLLTIAGVAKEGIIKQRAGEKAAKKMAGLVAQALEQSPEQC